MRRSSAWSPGLGVCKCTGGWCSDRPYSPGTGGIRRSVWPARSAFQSENAPARRPGAAALTPAPPAIPRFRSSRCPPAPAVSLPARFVCSRNCPVSEWPCLAPGLVPCRLNPSSRRRRLIVGRWRRQRHSSAIQPDRPEAAYNIAHTRLPAYCDRRYNSASGPCRRANGAGHWPRVLERYIYLQSGAVAIILSHPVILSIHSFLHRRPGAVRQSVSGRN